MKKYWHDREKIRKTINLTVATDIKGKGGIATVLQVMQSEGFFDKWNIKLISTHTQNNRMYGLLRVVTFIKSLFQIIAYHLLYNVDVVHIHMASRWSFKRKAIVTHLSKLLGSKVVIHLHGAEFKYFYHEECNKNQQAKIRQLFNKSDKIIVLSKQWYEWVSEITENTQKIHIIYNAVPVIQTRDSAYQHGLILFLGRLGKRKGVGDLILAFSNIAKEYPDAHLALGGDGDIAKYKDLVTRLQLEARITFLGWLCAEAKQRWMEKAAIYILPSYNEGFPMGVLEAMSAAVPVIASTAGGIPDAITHKKEGLLVNAGDIGAITSAIRTLLSDKEQGRQYSRNAKEKFLNNFSPKAVFPKLDNIYSSLKR